MAGRADAPRDLLLGLYALEGGAIDREQLVSAVRDWARSPDRTLSEILAGRGAVASSALALLEERVARDLGPPGGVPEPAATVAYDGQPLGGDAVAAGRASGDAVGDGVEGGASGSSDLMREAAWARSSSPSTAS